MTSIYSNEQAKQDNLNKIEAKKIADAKAVEIRRNIEEREKYKKMLQDSCSWTMEDLGVEL